MGKKVLERSAPILDETDRVLAIMEWQLFAQQQDSLAYSGDENEWRPGQPLYKYPDSWEGEQYVRPMIQELQDGNGYQEMLCPDCEVSWELREVDTCWSCGKMPESLKRLKEELAKKRREAVKIPAEVRALGYAPSHGLGRLSLVDWNLMYTEEVRRPRYRRSFDERTDGTRWDNVYASMSYDIDLNSYRFYLEYRAPNGVLFVSRKRVDAIDLMYGPGTEADLWNWMISDIEHQMR